MTALGKHQPIAIWGGEQSASRQPRPAVRIPPGNAPARDWRDSPGRWPGASQHLAVACTRSASTGTRAARAHEAAGRRKRKRRYGSVGQQKRSAGPKRFDACSSRLRPGRLQHLTARVDAPGSGFVRGVDDPPAALTRAGAAACIPRSGVQVEVEGAAWPAALCAATARRRREASAS